MIAINYESWKNEARQMRVDRFRIASPPIEPFEVTKLTRKLANRGIFYARTVSPIPSEVGRELAKLIDEQLQTAKGK